MPVCTNCDRRFVNAEALHQHLVSSSVHHPYCDKCNRRFISKTAWESHVSAKHPPAYRCDPCNREFAAAFALEDHYRGSNNHPNCTICGQGFSDLAERRKHKESTHSSLHCALCGNIHSGESNVDEHYHKSADHPSCENCDRGFFDMARLTEHLVTNHPGLHQSRIKMANEGRQPQQLIPEGRRSHNSWGVSVHWRENTPNIYPSSNPSSNPSTYTTLPQPIVSNLQDLYTRPFQWDGAPGLTRHMKEQR